MKLLLLFLIPVLRISDLNQPLYSNISNDTIKGEQANYCYMKDSFYKFGLSQIKRGIWLNLNSQ